jgi:hypothetical protein
MHACIQTVSKWWRRFDEQGSDGLLDEPRPRQPRKLSDAQIEQVIVRTLESKPPAATHWSTRTMAGASGINQTAISRIWRAFSLAPHRCETFKLSKDPLFIDKVRDIVGLYMNPPERALLLCVDENSQTGAPGKRSLLAGVELQALAAISHTDGFCGERWVLAAVEGD